MQLGWEWDGTALEKGHSPTNTKDTTTLRGICDDVSGLAGIGSQELLGIIIYKNWVVPGIFKDQLT